MKGGFGLGFFFFALVNWFLLAEFWKMYLLAASVPTNLLTISARRSKV